MPLPLSPDILRAAYDYLCATPPYRSWNLPDGEEVVFRVAKSTSHQGWYGREGGKHVICVSSAKIGRTISLIEVMAHEMVHLYQGDSRMETPGAEHNAAFRKLAARVCHAHGFDPKLF